MKSKTIKIENLFMYCKTLFEKAGVPEDEAYINDDNVVDANLMEVESHGVPRIPIYLKRIRKQSICVLNFEWCKTALGRL